jgi:hypothetical protein
MDGADLRDQCMKFAKTFSSDGSSDVDVNELISELAVLQFTLPDKPMCAMEIFEFTTDVDCYPNISHYASNGGLSWKNLSKSKIFEELFEVCNVSRSIKWFGDFMHREETIR